MCKGKYDLKPGKHKGKHMLKEVSFVGKPTVKVKGKKKTVPVGLYASKKDVMKY
jgi:hypothetical protein